MKNKKTMLYVISIIIVIAIVGIIFFATRKTKDDGKIKKNRSYEIVEEVKSDRTIKKQSEKEFKNLTKKIGFEESKCADTKENITCEATNLGYLNTKYKDTIKTSFSKNKLDSIIVGIYFDGNKYISSKITKEINQVLRNFYGIPVEEKQILEITQLLEITTDNKTSIRYEQGNYIEELAIKYLEKDNFYLLSVEIKPNL